MSDRLSEDQVRTLAAAMARVLPGDAGAPGAADAGAIAYVRWMEARGTYATVSSYFELGLSLLDSIALGLSGRAFADCDAATQDAALARLEGTPHPRVQRFFELLVRCTIGGFLCPPSYGGNRDEVGWRFIGFTPRVAAAVERET